MLDPLERDRRVRRLSAKLLPQTHREVGVERHGDQRVARAKPGRCRVVVGHRRNRRAA